MRLSNLFKKNKSAPLNKQDAFLNIVEARNILNKLKMDYWLTDGTLLGYYRNGDFIDHDEDLDFGARIDNFDERLLMDFVDNGWKLVSIMGNRNCGLEISFKKRGIKLDIFFFYREGMKLWHGAWRKIKEDGQVKRNLIKYYYDDFVLTKTDFKGESFNIPGETEKYISTKYGANWKTPVKKWDWEYGPSNAVKTDIVI